MRVLVIEDEVGLQDDIRRRLETEGYIVDTSGEGNEGLFFATEYPLDAATASHSDRVPYSPAADS